MANDVVDHLIAFWPLSRERISVTGMSIQGGLPLGGFLGGLWQLS